MEERDAHVYSEALRVKARASGSNGFGVEIDGWSKSLILVSCAPDQ